MINKRIAILTFHNTTNYGAMLQTFALQQYIKKKYGNATILNYENNTLTLIHRKQKFLQKRTLKQWVLYCLLATHTNRKVSSFHEFSLNTLTQSEKVYNKSTIKQSNDLFDIFIVGSDQVWNNDITKNDMTYLLDFVEEGKVISSYAASFGKESIPAELQEIYKHLLARFSLISVREKQGAKLVKSLVDKPVEVVLDPIFLLSKDEWSSIAVRPSFLPSKYILLYVFGRPRTLFEAARKIAKKTGYKIIILGTDYRKQFGFHYVGGVSPERFLSYFLHASYVLTNSFHGTAFSINFNKQFFIEMLPNNSVVNSRLCNILGIFNLEDREIGKMKSLDIQNEVDFGKVNEIISKEKTKSCNYIQKIINTCEE